MGDDETGAEVEDAVAGGDAGSRASAVEADEAGVLGLATAVTVRNRSTLGVETRQTVVEARQTFLEACRTVLSHCACLDGYLCLNLQ